MRTPTYRRIADELRGRIERREYRAGEALPAERALVEEFGAARMTVRQALDVLELEGLITRRRGRGGGTFVRSYPPVVELTRMEGFLPQLRARDLAVSSTVLDASLVQASPSVAQALHIAPGEPTFNVRRLRTVDETPLLIEDSFFPAALFPGLLEEDLTQSMYELLQRRFDLRPVWKSETVTPGIASGWEQSQLHVSRNLPLLRISRVAQTRGGVRVEYSKDVLRCDVAQIKVVTSDSGSD